MGILSLVSSLARGWARLCLVGRVLMLGEFASILVDWDLVGTLLT